MHHFYDMLCTGIVFKSTQPDESEEERRELERLVAEAAKPKTKGKKEKGGVHNPPQHASSSEAPSPTIRH
jgi:hypothetical protein